MRWRMLALLFFARIGLGFQFQTAVSVGDDLVTVFGIDFSEVGILIGLFMVPGLFLALPAGMSGRYASDRVLAFAGLGALALGGLLSGFGPGPVMIGFGRLIAGAGFLFSTLYFTKMVADWFEGREISTAMSILVMSWPFGIAMGQVGHAYLADLQDWRLPFVVASLYCAVAAAGVLLLYRAPDGKPAEPDESSNRLSGREWQLILLAGTAWGVFNAGYVAYLSFAPQMLEELGHAPLQAAALVSIASWIMIFSGAVCGQIVDRFNHRDLVLIVCMTGAVASLWLVGISGAGLAASLLFGLVGMAPAGVIMALSGEAVAPARRAFAMGIFFTVYYAIMAAGPPLSGWIYERASTAGASLAFGMGMFALVVPAVLMFRLVRLSGRADAPREDIG
ncbi:MFS transporter [Roseibium sp. HPY-6]|uniref:MFS transporter n=1 Tax=Roseibium sp. HPY-6 TaxID=3229852 RepID=UPI00338E55B7